MEESYSNGLKRGGTYAVDEVSVCASGDVDEVSRVVKNDLDVGDVALQLTPERRSTSRVVRQRVSCVQHNSQS